MRKLVGTIVAIGAVILLAGTSLACSVVAWNFEELAGKAEALVRGRVIRVEEGGRVAVLSVTSYLGPGAAPGTVQVGPTQNSGGREFGCPDLSVVFHKDQEYLVLLSGGRLAYPQGKTAVPVDVQGMVRLRGDSEQKRPAALFLIDFAVGHGLAAGGVGWDYIPLVIVLAAAGLGAGAVAWLRVRKTG